MPTLDFDDLVACLSIEHNASGAYRLPNVSMSYHRIFGGQLIAQSIVIASLSAPDKAVQSIHTMFAREGDLAQPVDFTLETLKDGRSFSLRSLLGKQGDKLIHASQVSLHVSEPGLEHQRSMPDVGPPESASAVAHDMIPWETRAVDAVDLRAVEAAPPDYAFWMRTPALGESLALHQGLLAHASTLTLIGTALRPHVDRSEADAEAGRIATAITSHGVWFHAPFRVDDWLLLSQESPRTAGARGFGLGHAFTREGRLVASFAQESLIRPVEA